MRSTSILVAALATAASAAVAEVTRPKIYFPKHVKREFVNSTSSSSSLSSASTSSDLSSESSDASSTPPGSTTSADHPRVTTIVIASTVWVTPGQIPSSSESAESSVTPSGGSASTGSLPRYHHLPHLRNLGGTRDKHICLPEHSYDFVRHRHRPDRNRN